MAKVLYLLAAFAICFTAVQGTNTPATEPTPAEEPTPATNPAQKLGDSQAQKFKGLNVIVLTWQRSGSTTFMSELSGYAGSECFLSVGFEGFNLGSKQTGADVLRAKHLDVADVRSMGPMAWTRVLWEHLRSKAISSHPDLQPDKVISAFKIMEGQTEPTFLLEAGLQDRKPDAIIILRVKDRYRQYLSAMRACWYDDWGGSGATRTHSEVEANLRERISRGETGCDHGNFTDFKRRIWNTYEMYRRVASDLGVPVFDEIRESSNVTALRQRLCALNQFNAALANSTRLLTQTTEFLTDAGLSPTVATPALTQGSNVTNASASSAYASDANASDANASGANASDATSGSPGGTDGEEEDSGAHSSATLAVFAMGAVVAASLALI